MPISAFSALPEVYGFLKPNIDAHSLGITHVVQLLKECGISAVIADESVSRALTQYDDPKATLALYDWIRAQRITRLGFSYRLDPREGSDAFGAFYRFLKEQRLFAVDGGPINTLYFAGLPAACEAVRRNFGKNVNVFNGEETPLESLLKLGAPRRAIPDMLIQSSEYDDIRMQIGRELIHKEVHKSIRPFDKLNYPGYGTFQDRLLSRLNNAKLLKRLPLCRAHVGPYRPDRYEAIQLFQTWLRQLAKTGLLDIASFGTSQLSQERFGEDWTGFPDGGGVPLNTPQEYRDAWEAAQPMLVRTYAGTKNISSLANMYEETINIAWHALSLWWFCKIDGRGPNTVLQNLCEHLDTLSFIAQSDKPYEPNVPHHFAFRGADDVTFVLSAYLAARTAKLHGVRSVVLQVMLNTPKQTWGIQDLAKARAMLQLVKTLEDQNFRIILQPRAGLDYFSPDPAKAMAQLAAVTMLMDDIEPDDPDSPPLIHVVSYSEGEKLATPEIINESIQITRSSLTYYRKLRKNGEITEVIKNNDLLQRTGQLVKEARDVLAVIHRTIDRPYEAIGLYKIFAAGFLPVPYLWQEREEFANAVKWRSRFSNGGVVLVDSDDKTITSKERAEIAADNLKHLHQPILEFLKK